METNIKKITNTLIDKLHIDQIYQWTYARDGKKLQILHIHLIPESGMRFGEAKDICLTLFERYQDIHFTLYYRHEVQQLIDQGLGRFLLVCRPENKIYQNEATSGDVLLTVAPIDNIAKRSAGYIETEKKKTLSFLDGYHFYLNNGNHAHASFMLHQAIELALRTAFMILVGYEKKSHSLVNKIIHLKTFDSILGRLSIKDKDMLALRQLDNSYSAFRYNQGFQIDKSHIEAAYQIMERAMAWMEGYQAEYVLEIEKQLDPEYIAQKRIERLKEKYNDETAKLDPTNHRALIVRALEIYCQPKLVKCFAYRSTQRQLSNLIMIVDDQSTVHHYYLFLTTNDAVIHIMDVQQKINQLLPDHIHATLLIEHAGSLIQKARKRNLFFYDILQGGETWLDEDSISEQDIQALPPPHRGVTYAKKQWSTRVQNARLFSAMYHNLDCIGDERAVCFALAIATEQICLGLIKLFIGYSPNVINLNYLMSLVDIILPEASAAFYRDRETDNDLFKLLSEAQKEFRHSPNYITGEFEVGILHDRVNEFINIASSEVKAYFETHVKDQGAVEENDKEDTKEVVLSA